jgi:hypothetical protein
MTIVLDHTIVPARDKEESARFFASSKPWHLFLRNLKLVQRSLGGDPGTRCMPPRP